MEETKENVAETETLIPVYFYINPQDTMETTQNEPCRPVESTATEDNQGPLTIQEPSDIISDAKRLVLNISRENLPKFHFYNSERLKESFKSAKQAALLVCLVTNSRNHCLSTISPSIINVFYLQLL